jgi:ribosome biogenesis GTPase
MIRPLPSPYRSRSRSQRAAAIQPDSRQVAPPEGSIPGLVVRSHGLWHEVVPAGEQEPVIATVRGQLKRHRRGTDVVAVGDRVWISRLPDNEAVIEHVEPRTRTLGRTARHTRDVEQVILANPDQVLFVFSIHQPEPHLRMLDRFIILAELQEIPIRIVVTKMDLDGLDGAIPARDLFADHARVFPVHYISTVTGEGMDDLRTALDNQVSAVAGPSGVGKSSLLNTLDPDTDRETSAVSTATGKGRHTTVGARLHQLDATTFVADTPGMRAIAMRAVPSDKLDWCFREFRPYLGRCYYQDCMHVSEPGCAVRDAVERDDIAASRYASYVALRQGDEIADTPDWA